jgi:hypothetical protein
VRREASACNEERDKRLEEKAGVLLDQSTVFSVTRELGGLSFALYYSRASPTATATHPYN